MAPGRSDQPLRELTDAEIADFYRDGAAVLRGVIDDGWIAGMRTAIDRILTEPGSASVEYTPRGKSGRYYGDFFVWRRDPDFEAFMRRSPLPGLAARIMASRAVHFFYDQLLVKEPGTEEPTPWHHDLPYWPVRGAQVISFWVPFDRVTLASGAVQYLAGSHLWGTRYAPAAFGKDTGYAELYAKMGLQPVPDVEATRARHRILHWDVEPSDVIIHHALTLHYSTGNASATERRRGLALRYVGDDAVWDARPGTFIENAKLKALLPPITLADGDTLGGELFPRVWPPTG
jgi:ectoine hydroxylase-related dioxygenase (phytanoyl-CoA dioxygenase family)